MTDDPFWRDQFADDAVGSDAPTGPSRADRTRVVTVHGTAGQISHDAGSAPAPGSAGRGPDPDGASVTVLAGGRVIDPASGLDAVADVVCAGGRIRAVLPVGTAPAHPAGAMVIDCADLLVTPGLIDLHTHVYPGLGDFCVHPDRAGVDVGVPVVVDGGTSGVRTFGLARAFTESEAVHTRVLAFLDPCLLYLATKDFIAHRLEIANDPRNLDLDATAATVEAHRDMIVGFKVRATTTDDPGRSPFLEGAKSIAGDLPIMVHMGHYPYTPSLANLDAITALRPGDIVTHAFRGHSGVLVDGDRAVDPRFAAAVEAGLRLDVGHSGSDFRFAAARALLDLGYPPTTISTDLNLFNTDGPVWSLTETMSKIWALGVDLVDVIAMVTSHTAAAIGRGDELGTLDVGRNAEVSVLRVESGTFEFTDGFETIRHPRRLAPVGCLRAGVWYKSIGQFGPAPVTSGLASPPRDAAVGAAHRPPRSVCHASAAASGGSPGGVPPEGEG
jgi:dihydroorotase